MRVELSVILNIFLLKYEGDISNGTELFGNHIMRYAAGWTALLEGQLKRLEPFISRYH